MKKIINSPENFIKEMLEGIYAAHPDMVTYAGGDLHCLVTKYKKPGKVGIATGGGSGHLPLFLGYCGQGMLDGCSIGDVFQSPSAEQMLAVTKEIDSGAGVLYIYGDVYKRQPLCGHQADIPIRFMRCRSCVRCRNDVGQGKQRVGGIHRLFFEYVQCGAEEVPGFQRLVKRVLVHQNAAGSIDKKSILLHLGKRFGIHDVLIFRKIWNMETDNVAAGEQLIGRDKGNPQLFGFFFIGVLVTGDDSDVHAAQFFCNAACDVPKSVQTDRLPHQLIAHGAFPFAFL